MARKQNQRNRIIIVLVAFAILGIMAYNFDIFPFAIGGTTILSIDDVIVDSSNKIRVVASAGSGAEALNINWKQSELDSYLNQEGLDATKDINGRIELLENSKVFTPIKNNDRRYKTIQSGKVGFVSPFIDEIQKCKDSGFTNTFNYYYEGLGTLHCVYFNIYGNSADFANSQEEVDFLVSFNIDGSTGELTSDRKSITLNDGKTKVEWVGQLSNVFDFSAPQYDAIFSGSTFYLVSDGSWIRAEALFNNFESCLNKENRLGNYETCLSTYSDKLLPEIKSRDKEYKSSSTKIENIGFESGKLVVRLTQPSSFPLFTITLDAKSVGIVELKGEPKINSINPKTLTIKSGDIGELSISITNVAQADGSFFGEIICVDSNVKGNFGEVFFKAGETKEVKFNVNGQNLNEGTLETSCNLKVTDRKSLNSDNIDFNVNVEYQSGIICQENQNFCIGKDVHLCNAQGTDSELIESCDVGCLNGECVGGNGGDDGTIGLATCESCDAYARSKLFGWVDKIKFGENDPIKEDVMCEAKSIIADKKIFGFIPQPQLPQTEGTCVFSFVKYIMAYAGILLGFFFTYPYFRNKKEYNKTKGVPEVLAGLVGLAIGIAGFYIWWLALGGIVIAFILNNQINKII